MPHGNGTMWGDGNYEPHQEPHVHAPSDELRKRAYDARRAAWFTQLVALVAVTVAAVLPSVSDYAFGVFAVSDLGTALVVVGFFQAMRFKFQRAADRVEEEEMRRRFEE